MVCLAEPTPPGDVPNDLREEGHSVIEGQKKQEETESDGGLLTGAISDAISEESRGIPTSVVSPRFHADDPLPDSVCPDDFGHSISLKFDLENLFLPEKMEEPWNLGLSLLEEAPPQDRAADGGHCVPLRPETEERPLGLRSFLLPGLSRRDPEMGHRPGPPNAKRTISLELVTPLDSELLAPSPRYDRGSPKRRPPRVLPSESLLAVLLHRNAVFQTFPPDRQLALVGLLVSWGRRFGMALARGCFSHLSYEGAAPCRPSCAETLQAEQDMFLRTIQSCCAIARVQERVAEKGAKSRALGYRKQFFISADEATTLCWEEDLLLPCPSNTSAPLEDKKSFSARPQEHPCWLYDLPTTFLPDQARLNANLNDLGHEVYCGQEWWAAPFNPVAFALACCGPAAFRPILDEFGQGHVDLLKAAWKGSRAWTPGSIGSRPGAGTTTGSWAWGNVAQEMRGGFRILPDAPALLAYPRGLRRPGSISTGRRSNKEEAVELLCSPLTRGRGVWEDERCIYLFRENYRSISWDLSKNDFGPAVWILGVRLGRLIYRVCR